MMFFLDIHLKFYKMYLQSLTAGVLNMRSKSNPNKPCWRMLLSTQHNGPFFSITIHNVVVSVLLFSMALNLADR